MIYSLIFGLVAFGLRGHIVNQATFEAFGLRGHGVNQAMFAFLHKPCSHVFLQLHPVCILDKPLRSDQAQKIYLQSSNPPLTLTGSFPSRQLNDDVPALTTCPVHWRYALSISILNIVAVRLAILQHHLLLA